jgi:hypothetical protein
LFVGEVLLSSFEAMDLIVTVPNDLLRENGLL